MDLSIIIVNYGTYKLTKEAIDSILKYPPKSDFEIFLVDNASKDNSYEKLRNNFKNEIEKGIIKTIANSTNDGFAVANNLAIKKARGNFILLLNSDTIVKKDTLNLCLKYIKNHPDVGVLGCKISLPNGKLDKACKRNFPNPKNSFQKLFGFSTIFSKHGENNNNTNSYNLDNLDDNGVYEVDCLVGAFMLLRKSTINEVGLLDENFFMYGEDIDWCYRIKEKGWKVIYYGKAEIIHYKSASSKKQKSKLIYEFYRAMYLFYNKHYQDKYSIFTKIVVYLGIAILLIIKLFLNIFKKNH